MRRPDPSTRGPIVGLALFGSRARGDSRPDSDTDVLCITESGQPDLAVEGRLALAFYPLPMLLRMAREGDLFAGHLSHEAIPLWDPADLLSELRSTYQPPGDLDQVIRRATDVGRLLIERALHFPPDLLNRRMAWVARTVMTAEATRRGLQLYAAEPLAQLVGSRSALRIVKGKDDTEFDAEKVAELAAFLDEYGLADLARPGEGWLSRFDRTGNSFGLKTLVQLDGLEPPSAYS